VRDTHCISGNISGGEAHKHREGFEKRNKGVTSICNSCCDVGMLAGAHQLCTVTLMDAGERIDFLTKYSSVKICLFVAPL